MMAQISCFNSMTIVLKLDARGLQKTIFFAQPWTVRWTYSP